MHKETAMMLGKPNVTRWVIFGFIILFVFFSIFVLWAGLVPIESATITKGTVTIKGKHKKIQHLEGGIIKSLNVKEHTLVKKNQLLLRLKSTRAKANLDLLNHQYYSASAIASRLAAEKNSLHVINWYAGLDQNITAHKLLMNEQSSILKKRSATLRGQTELLENKILQTKSKLKGYNNQLLSVRKQYNLISQEVASARVLADKGLATNQRVLSLEREGLTTEERLRSLKTNISAAKFDLEDGQLQITNIKNASNDEIAGMLQQTELRISDLKQKLKAAKDVFNRTMIRSPIEGVVINLTVTTVGSVIESGETIMELVPSDAKFTVETRIDPNDIDVVQIGARTQINLTSYKQRISPRLDGNVINISADILIDGVTGEKFYSAIIEIEPSSLEKYSALQLYPGMPANIMIISESRTVIEYLFQPVIESFHHAFREK